MFGSLLFFFCVCVSFWPLIVFSVGGFSCSVTMSIRFRVLFRTTLILILLFLLWSTLQRSQWNAQRALAISISVCLFVVVSFRFHSLSVNISRSSWFATFSKF